MAISGTTARRGGGLSFAHDPRHAAALALLGWYLMVPPPLRAAGGAIAMPGTADIETRWYLMLPPVNAGKVDSTAPLSKWMQLRAFDWASDCDREKWQWVADRTIAALYKSKTNDERTKARITGGQYFESRCIATDDPRLKEK